MDFFPELGHKSSKESRKSWCLVGVSSSAKKSSHATQPHCFVNMCRPRTLVYIYLQTLATYYCCYIKLIFFFLTFSSLLHKLHFSLFNSIFSVREKEGWDMQQRSESASNWWYNRCICVLTTRTSGFPCYCYYYSVFRLNMEIKFDPWSGFAVCLYQL